MTSEYLSESSEELEQRLVDRRVGSNQISPELEMMIIEDIIRLDTSIAEDKAQAKFCAFIALLVMYGAVIISSISGGF